jgi:hypothetical protein
MTKIPTAKELLELDIDLRLFNLCLNLLEAEALSAEVVLSYIRAAYGMGYLDALKEPADMRGELCTKHGYALPGQ